MARITPAGRVAAVAIAVLCAAGVSEASSKSTQYQFPVNGYVHAQWEQALAGAGAPSYGFVLRRARLKFRHSFVEQVRTELEVGFDEFDLELKDALAEFRPWTALGFRAGLGKTGFSREELTPVSDLLFAERGVTNDEFEDRGYLGRDIGLAASGELFEDRLGYEFGVYNGNRARLARDDNNAKQFCERVTFRPADDLELGVNATQRNDSLTGRLVQAFGLDAGWEAGPARVEFEALCGEAEPGQWMLGGTASAGYRLGAIEPKLRAERFCPDLGDFGSGRMTLAAGANWFLHKWLELKADLSVDLRAGEDAALGLLVQAQAGI
ncbi:hypothetical protein JXB37_07765 [candidate division WOR-3 bacterium]|nr:hypothetical protein [candidate division WOR-3 bacterium]